MGMDDDGNIHQFAEGAAIPAEMTPLTGREARAFLPVPHSRRKLKLRQMRMEAKARAKQEMIREQQRAKQNA